MKGDVLYSDEVFTVAINPNLDEDSQVMVLETTDDRVMAVLTPALADKVGLYQRQDLSEEIFRRKLNEAGVTLHGADYLFYFSETDKNVLLQENLEGDLRQLMPNCLFGGQYSRRSSSDEDHGSCTGDV
ncbi:hypothetical protein MNQ98_15160 [Paenibacillus sp. N3/727]|uniref:hypothetical protein n=1 Tax=Paenibacillus sp. N3/727 TaxID=2925845 RepID=UPI001F52B9B0|nr:hypothetical protein [Paenibacillus sp. N3/727]UNK15897.1 hypothetical protein MNQ98_15160 [Paenibacillus sp. N3/727]